jgi:hypothetical protein
LALAGGADRLLGKDGEAPIRWKALEPADDFPTNFPIEAGCAAIERVRQANDACPSPLR